MGLYGNDVYLWIIENNGMKNTYPPYIIVVGEYLRRIKKMIRFLFLGSFPNSVSCGSWIQLFELFNNLHLKIIMNLLPGFLCEP